MKQPSILTPAQQQFLTLFAQSSPLTKLFYLTGGAALAAYYVPYRYSEDLDFFSEKEVDTQSISVFLKSIKPHLGYRSMDFNTSYNRNLFFLQFPKETLKVEFTYFPFPPIETPQNKAGILVDSLLDIAVNKLFTIYQQPRSRDFMDLYMIHASYRLSLAELMKKARIKFDWHIDPLKLGSQLLQARTLKDYPKLVKPLKDTLWQEYFTKEAKKLKSDILESQ